MCHTGTQPISELQILLVSACYMYKAHLFTESVCFIPTSWDMCKPGDQLQDPKTFMSHVFLNFWLTCCLSMKLPLKLETIHFFLIKKTFKFSRGWNFPYGICGGETEWKHKHPQRFKGCQILTTLYPSLPFVSVQESTSGRGRCQNGISMSVFARHLQQVVFFANMPWKIWKTNEQ